MLLGELLVQDGVITPDQLETALNHQKRYGGLLGVILVNMGILSEGKLVDCLLKQSLRGETYDNKTNH